MEKAAASNRARREKWRVVMIYLVEEIKIFIGSQAYFQVALIKGLPETLRHIAKHLHPFAVVWLLTLNNYSTGNFVQK